MSITQFITNFLSAVPAETSSESQIPVGGVRIDSVSKRFRRRTVKKKSYSTVKSSLLSRISERRRDRGNLLTALEDISIEVAPGSALGVIGRNGSGKSTLLKLIAGIYQPSEGQVSVNGKVSALIELGAGFHPDFSGRENVYLGGIMYGLSRKQIDARFDDIVGYAELEDFIDDPVRTYSSGMYMRLGFSLAIHSDPDILLIDEVLAVGDAAFVHRCKETISEFKRQGKTLIFVTHDLASVARWCDQAIWLEKGVIQQRGEPRRIIDSYLGRIESEEEVKLQKSNQAEAIDAKLIDTEQRWGNLDVEITDVQMLGVDGSSKWLFHSDEGAVVEVSYKINTEVDDLVFGVGVLRDDGLEVHGNNTDIDQLEVPIPEASEVASFPVEGVYRYKISRLGLLEGSYYLDVAAHRSDGVPFDYHHRVHKFSVRSAEKYSGVYTPEHSWEFDVQYPVAEIEKTAAKKKAVGEA